MSVPTGRGILCCLMISFNLNLFLRDAFFCLAKRKRPSDSPPGCARRQCETLRWAVVLTCRPVTLPSRRPASKGNVGNALSAGTARPSSPAAMCRLWTGNVRARDVRCEKTFSLRVPRAGGLARPLAARRETAARPEVPTTPRYASAHSSPCQGELSAKLTEGSTAKNVREFAEFPDAE